MSVDGGKRVINADGDLIEAAVRLGIDAVNSAFSGGTKAPNANQQQVLIDAGYTLQQQNQANPRTRNLQNWIAPDGTVYGPGTSREIAQQLIRNPPAARPPAAGPTGPDNAGFPISIPLPSIPDCRVRFCCRRSRGRSFRRHCLQSSRLVFSGRFLPVAGPIFATCTVCPSQQAQSHGLGEADARECEQGRERYRDGAIHFLLPGRRVRAVRSRYRAQLELGQLR